MSSGIVARGLLCLGEKDERGEEWEKGEGLGLNRGIERNGGRKEGTKYEGDDEIILKRRLNNLEGFTVKGKEGGEMNWWESVEKRWRK